MAARIQTLDWLNSRIDGLERQLAEARKQAFEDAERIVYNGGWWAAAEALRREAEKHNAGGPASTNTSC